MLARQVLYPLKHASSPILVLTLSLELRTDLSMTMNSWLINTYLENKGMTEQMGTPFLLTRIFVYLRNKVDA
jgi:hypothetical protein